MRDNNSEKASQRHDNRDGDRKRPPLVFGETWRQHRVIDACAVALRFAAATLSRDTLRSGPFTVGRAVARGNLDPHIDGAYPGCRSSCEAAENKP